MPYFTGSDGVIRGPAGNGAVSWICRDDIADIVVVTILGSADRDGNTYDNTGPAAHTLGETAAILSEGTGRSLSYHEETVEEAWESRRPSGAPDWEIEGWVTSYGAIATGEMATVSDAVERVTGHPPHALDPFLPANPHLWAHLVQTP